MGNGTSEWAWPIIYPGKKPSRLTFLKASSKLAILSIIYDWHIAAKQTRRGAKLQADRDACPAFSAKKQLGAGQLFVSSYIINSDTAKDAALAKFLFNKRNLVR